MQPLQDIARYIDVASLLEPSVPGDPDAGELRYLFPAGGRAPPLTNGRDADRSRFGSGAHGPKEFTQGSAGGVRWGIARTLSSRAHSLSGWLALTAPSISVRDAERRGLAGPSLGEVRPSGPSLKLLALADAKGADAIL